jgi:alanine racemase
MEWSAGMDLKQTRGEPRLLISRSALLQNVRTIRNVVRPGTKICAIVKADAYGHGGALVADALCNFATDQTDSPAAEQLAVATMDEAAALVENLLPITVLRPVENVFLGRQRAALEHAIRSGWTLTLTTAAAADDVARIALACGRRAKGQVMIDTGMTRAGVSLQQTEYVVRRILSRPVLQLTAVGTHFANSEVAGDAFTAEQLNRFHQVTDALLEEFDGKLTRHAANSGAVFFTPGAHFDMVRPGLAIYGIDPTGRPSMNRALRPVMKWTAPLIGIRDIPAGTTVGYGQTYCAPRGMRVGLVPVGYADGYLRAFSNRGVMLLQGETCPVVGRVSMDLTTIDLTNVPHASLGDELTLLDNDPLSPCSVYELAKWADTIPYEILVRIGPRVKRVATEPQDGFDAVVDDEEELLSPDNEF